MSTCRFLVPKYTTRPAWSHPARPDQLSGAERLVVVEVRPGILAGIGGHCGVRRRHGKLAPNHLARTGPSGSPSLRDLADYLQPPATLVKLGRLAQPPQRRGIVDDLTEQPALQDEAEADLALRITHGVGHQLRYDQFGERGQLGQAPLPQRAPDQRTGAPRGG